MTKTVPFFVLLLFCTAVSAQQGIGDSSLSSFPLKFFSKIDKKFISIDDQLSKQTAKYLRRSEKIEQKLLRKLRRTDSAAYAKLQNDIAESYIGITKNIQQKASNVQAPYNAYLDTASTALAFLKNDKKFAANAALPLEKIKQLQQNLQQSERVKQFITERKQLVTELLSKYTHLPAGIKKHYDNLKKNTYYYAAQVQEYKDILNDTKKLERKALELLNKVPAFKEFMKAHSSISSLFNIPAKYGDAGTLNGLQTRSYITELLKQAGGSSGGAQEIHKKIQIGTAEIDNLKGKLLRYGSTENPDFKVNGQKVKPFFKRIEYGYNFQFGKENSFLPNGADMAITVGYKLNDFITAGIGISYNLGIGSFKKIQFSNKGYSLRTYMESKIKRGWFFSGGYERTFNASMVNVPEYADKNHWQNRALTGINKKIKMGKNKKSNIQLLYDFLAHQHNPSTASFLFRVGYNFSKD